MSEIASSFNNQSEPVIPNPSTQNQNRTEAQTPEITSVTKSLHNELIKVIREADLGKIRDFCNQIADNDPVFNYRDEIYQQTPLYAGAQVRDLSLVFEISKLLYQKGAKLQNRDTNGQNVLFYICKEGNVNLLKYLSEQEKLDFNETDSFQQTPIFYAARDGRSECLKEMIRLGANPNHKDQVNETALFYAARDGKTEAVKVLIENGADPNIIDHKKQTALFFAKKNGHKEIIDFLVEHGAINTKDGKINKNQFVKSRSPNNEVEIAKSQTSTPVISKRKKPEKTEVLRVSYKLQYTDKDLNTRDMTETDFEDFKINYPNIAELLMNPDLLSFNPELKERVNGESWQNACLQLMASIWKIKNASLFYNPVDPEKLCIPDYPMIVKKPMDFGTIKKKLNSNVYASLEEFLADLNLVFSNCALYNGIENAVGLMGTQIKAETDKLISEMKLVERFSGQGEKSNCDIPPLKRASESNDQIEVQNN